MKFNLLIGVLVALSFVYWQLLFHLITQILGKMKVKKICIIPISIINVIVPFLLSKIIDVPNMQFIVMLVLMILEFWLLFRCKFTENIFCALACIIHVLIARTMIMGIFSAVTRHSFYEISALPLLNVTYFAVLFFVIDIAIIVVLRILPIDIVRIINQHKDPQMFLIMWMAINSIYLLYNADVLYRPNMQVFFGKEQVAISLAIFFGLYIVMFFAIKAVKLLGYKEKSNELELAMVQEQQYRNSITKDAIASFVVNLTQNTITDGFEEIKRDIVGSVYNYSDMLAFTANKVIHSDDINCFLRYASPSHLIHEFERGKCENFIEYRRLTENNEYIWVRSIVNLLEDIGSCDIIAYVYIKDINKEKLRELELQRMAERDPLTGLYNKEITAKLINENLSEEDGVSILFMVDIDNFKAINDHLSHAFGDAVLCEMSDKLRSIFKRDDIIGRIGGDEFIVYVKNDISVTAAQIKAEEICQALHVTYNGAKGETYTISSSIGIAVAPRDGNSFKKLYKNADIALYGAKNAGKNNYKFYEGTDFLGYESNRTEIQADVVQKNFRDNRVEYVFKILYQSDNSVKAIHSVLELVASHFSFERGYIFETAKDGKTTSNTFEWCAEGIAPQIDNLQNLPIDVVSVANENFYKTGTYIVKNLNSLLNSLTEMQRCVLEPQGVKSMFQFGLFDKRKLLGFIGFDSCKTATALNDTEIDEVTTICNILATFFVKQRNDEIALQDLQVRQEVMNHLNNFVYVINPQNFEVMFMNEQTRKRVGDVKCQTPCYRFFRGNSEQCDDCPIKKLNGCNVTPTSYEIYNDKLSAWTQTTASIIHWTDGSLAYLVECADVTKQKEEHLKHIKQLENIAFVDELTGTRTFLKFKEDAKKILESQTAHFLVKLDIDNFKLINQLYGYEQGNEVLRCVVKALEKTARSQDEIFARVSNDEFVALFSIQEKSTINKLYDNFLHNFNSLISNELAFRFTFPHGIYIIKPNMAHELNINDLFEKVNIAHKEAKLDKSKKFVIYDESLTRKALRTKEIENKMTDALLNDEFMIYLQPKYYLDTEMVGGAEALSRWKNENGDLFYPDAFISVFERNGFITKLDLYVLRKVCYLIKSWIEKGISPVTVSVNFSRLHLSNPNFVQELCDIVDSVSIDRKYIEIEITETAMYDNIDTLEIVLNDLHENGFAMSIDDFGSGYSSLGMLKDLPVDVIKIDRSFFANQKDVERSKIVVASILEMAENLGINIVAEGVEEQQQIDLLRELQCDMVQGYYYAKPMPSNEFTDLIESPTKFIGSGDKTPPPQFL